MTAFLPASSSCCHAAKTTLDRLGRSTQNILAFAEELRGRGAVLRVLNLGGGDVDTATPMGSMLFTIMAAFGQMEHEIKRERVIDSIAKRRGAGKNLGGRPRIISDGQIRNARSLIDSGEPAAEVAPTIWRRTRVREDLLPPDRRGTRKTTLLRDVERSRSTSGQEERPRDR